MAKKDEKENTKKPTEKDEKLAPGSDKDTTEEKDSTDKPDEKKSGGKKGNVIEVSEDVLRDLINSNKELASKVEKLESNAASSNPVKRAKKIREHTARVRKWDGKYVMGFENIGNAKRPRYVYDLFDKDRREVVQYVNLILQDGEVAKNVVYLDFLRDAEVEEKCKIIKTEKDQDIIEQGLVPKKEMTDSGYGMYETTVMVPVEIITDKYIFVLKVEDSEEPIEFSEEAINI